MVTIDALDKFVHTLSGNVFHIEFDRCGNGRRINAAIVNKTNVINSTFSTFLYPQ